MGKTDRQREILAALRFKENPVTGAALAAQFGVSRQIIVKDIAALRRAGEPVLSTPGGYALSRSPAFCVITCRHDGEFLLEQELYTVVEGGGWVIDVIVEHPRYGQMRNELMIGTARDVMQFMKDMKNGRPLCALTGGVHMHTLRAPDEEALAAITGRLSALGILLEARPGLL